MDRKEQEEINEILTYVNTRNEIYIPKRRNKLFALLLIGVVLFYFLKNFVPKIVLDVSFTAILIIASVFLVLFFKDKNLEGLFINLIIILASVIFILGYFVEIVFYILTIVVLLYFIYLTVKRSKNFALAVIFTFFIIVYSLIYYFPNVFKLLPIVEKTSQVTSKTTHNAVSDALKSTTSNILNSIKTAFLPLTNPEEFQAMMEKEKLKKKELPSLGKYTGVTITKIIPSNLPLTDYKGRVLLNIKTSFDKDFLNLLNSLSNTKVISDNFWSSKSNFTCFVIDENSLEKSGFCKINNKNYINITKTFGSLSYYEKDVNLNINYEDYITSAIIRIKNNNELFSVVVGRIEDGKIKAVQMDNPLKISLSFLNFKDEKRFSVLLAYLEDINNFENNDIINTKNQIEKIEESYICFLIPEQNPIEKVEIEGKPINSIERGPLKCYKLVDNLDFSLSKGFYKTLLDIYYNNNIKYISVDFYIITKYKLLKLADIPIKVNFELLPLLYLEKYYSLEPEKIFEIINATWEDLTNSKDFIINFYNTLNKCSKDNGELLNENIDLKKFNNKDKIFSLVLLAYFYNRDKLGQIQICNDFGLNLSECNEENLERKINDILTKIKDLKNKIKECNLILGSSLRFDTSLILGLFDYYLNSKNELVSCKDLEENYEKGENLVKNIKNLYEKSVRYLIIKNSN